MRLDKDFKKELNDAELDDELGFQVVTMDECNGKIDFFTSATGNFTKQVKNNAIVGNYGRFDKETDRARVDKEIDLPAAAKRPRL